MRDVLLELNNMPGVRGSAIVLGDGVIIANALSVGSDPDSYSALASSLLSQIVRSLPRLQIGNLRRAMITATRGRFALCDLGGAWLVAEVDREIETAELMLEIESAASRLRKRMRMRGTESGVPAPLPTADGMAATLKENAAAVPPRAMGQQILQK